MRLKEKKMLIRNKPKCRNHDKCGNEALTWVNGIWMCGPCVLRVNEKVKKIKERLLIEDGFGDI